MRENFDFSQCAEPLLEWFLENARELPWRSKPAPYRVWVSEIMLQQTRVEAVKPYFARFMKELPTVEALANCPEDKLLKLWEGLGYYNRVRNLQKAAVQIVTEYGGQIPAEYENLLKLKGIGHYTAGAIASIAYGKPVPAVDGNVLRVLTRLTADTTDIAKPAFRTEVENTLKTVLMETVLPAGLKQRLRNENVAGSLNQALMELGALVCVPNGEPLCNKCPWENQCLAYQDGLTGEIPVKSKAKARRIEPRTVFLLRDGDKVAIRKRANKGLLAGLYEFPNVPGTLEQEEALKEAEKMGCRPIRIRKLKEAKHIFSHVEWHMSGYAVLVEEPENETGDLIFVDAKEASSRYAIPSAFAAYAGELNILLGNENMEPKH